LAGADLAPDLTGATSKLKKAPGTPERLPSPGSKL
jgi:hypothetical protein